MLLLRSVVVLCLCLVGPAFGQGLTAAECAEIQSAYGVTPPECRGASQQISQYPQYPQAVTLTAPTEAMRQNNIFFAQGGAELDATALLQIKRLADVLNAPSMQRACLRLVGHSDTTGGNLINMEMGAKRAAAVQGRLSLLLLNPTRIEVVQSLGEDSPLPGLSPESRWQRRVEIWARDCPGYAMRRQ